MYNKLFGVATYIYNLLHPGFQIRSNECFPLRSEICLCIPFRGSSQSQTSLSFDGPKIWNDIAEMIQRKSTITTLSVLIYSIVGSKIFLMQTHSKQFYILRCILCVRVGCLLISTY